MAFNALIILAVAIAIAGVVFLVLSCVVAAERSRFTPLYEDIACRISEAPQFSFGITVEVAIDVDVTLSCTNPNPYDVRVHNFRPGRLLIGDQQAEVGTMIGQNTVLPSGQNGEMQLAARARMNLMQALTLVGPTLLGGGGSSAWVALFEVSADLLIEPAFLGVIPMASFDEKLETKCGMRVSMTPMRAGDAVCGADWSTLEVPPLGSGMPSGELTPEVDEEVIRNGEETRDSLCIILITVFVLLGAIMLAIASSLSCVWYRQRHVDKSTVVQGVPMEPTQLGNPCDPDPEAAPVAMQLDSPEAAAAPVAMQLDSPEVAPVKNRKGNPAAAPVRAAFERLAAANDAANNQAGHQQEDQPATCSTAKESL